MKKDEILFKQSEKIGTEESFVLKTTSNVTTTDATPTLIGEVPVLLDTTASYRVVVTARQIGGALGVPGASATFIGIQGLLYNPNIATSIGTSTNPATPTYSSPTAATWVVELLIPNPSEVAQLFVTGETDKTINWSCVIETQVVKYVSK